MNKIYLLLKNPATTSIVVLNLLVFVALQVFSDFSNQLYLYPETQVILNKPWTLVTVLFSHEVFVHLLLNMALMLVFSVKLERIAGYKTVIVSYLLSGVVGSLVTIPYASVVGWSNAEPVIGASAAVFGVVATFVALRANEKILWYPAKQWLMALFVVNALIAFMNPEVSVGALAHAAGLVTGFLFGNWLKKNHKSN